MGILSCSRSKGYPKTKRSLEGRGTLAQIKTSHRDRYEIEVDSDNDIADIILDDLPFAVGESFDTGNTDIPTILTEISLDRDVQVRRRWIADLSFEELAISETPESGSPPDSLIPEWSWSAETIDKDWFIDADGNQIATSAGEQIALAMPLAIPVLTIERYEASFDPSVIIDYMNHRNSSPFWGADEDQVICAAIEDRKDTHVVFGGQFYRKVRYVFKFAVPFIEEVLEGWTDVLIDRGTFYKDSNGNKLHFKVGAGETTGNLDGHGGKATDGQYFVQRVNRFPPADFNDLYLGPF